jgi:all-trans-retinol dehydrogenase (NAD+)
MSKLDGKRVLITGGAQGIGFEMATKFAGRGSEIVLGDINVDKLAEAKAQLEARGATAWGFKVDVTNPASIASLRAQIAAEVGPIDVLVNNAGVVFGGPFTQTSLDRHFRTYQVNLLGLVAMTHAFLDDLIARPEAHLVHISSASGLLGLPYGSTYASSKWAVIGFGESIRAELNVQGHDHVHHTIVCPSYIGTGMFQGAKAPIATPFLQPERIAEKVVQAVERDSVYVMEPFMVKLTPVIKALLPTSLTDKISNLFGADKSMAKWTGRQGETSSDSDEVAASKVAATPPTSAQREAER